jgi:CarD family transcriptional regulator
VAGAPFGGARPYQELPSQVPTKSATAKKPAQTPDITDAASEAEAPKQATKKAASKKPPLVPVSAEAPETSAHATPAMAEAAPEPQAEAAAQPASALEVAAPDTPPVAPVEATPAAPVADALAPAAAEVQEDASVQAEAAEAPEGPEAAAASAVKDEDEDDEDDDSPSPPPRPHGSPGHHMMGRNQAIAPGGRVMPPPRAMAKAEIFEEGDHVVYPTHGVGKVERIATEEIAGHKLELIHITFEENRMTLRVPVAKARTAGLRKLATRKMFDEALAVLRGRARIKRTMWSRRAQEYEAKINSGDPLAIAEVVRDLHRNAGQPDQSFSERQIYEAAMDRLAAELGALDRIDKAAAAVKLAEFLKTVA